MYTVTHLKQLFWNGHEVFQFFFATRMRVEVLRNKRFTVSSVRSLVPSSRATAIIVEIGNEADG